MEPQPQFHCLRCRCVERLGAQPPFGVLLKGHLAGPSPASGPYNRATTCLYWPPFGWHDPRLLGWLRGAVMCPASRARPAQPLKSGLPVETAPTRRRFGRAARPTFARLPFPTLLPFTAPIGRGRRTGALSLPPTTPSPRRNKGPAFESETGARRVAATAHTPAEPPPVALRRVGWAAGGAGRHARTGQFAEPVGAPGRPASVRCR